jgi:DNA invertase Pin-like site-specific DNA recombinase
LLPSLNRLSRDTVDTLHLINNLSERGVRFKALNIELDTTSPTGKFAVTVMAAVAELERVRLRKRQANGIAKAKRKGKYKSRMSEYHKHVPIVKTFFKWAKARRTFQNN